MACTPARAGRRLSGSFTSPATCGTPAGRLSLRPSLVRARTGWPSAASRRTSSFPTFPVAPVIRYTDSAYSLRWYCRRVNEVSDSTFGDGRPLWLGRLDKVRNVVRQEMISRQLDRHLGAPPARILDVGA